MWRGLEKSRSRQGLMRTGGLLPLKCAGCVCARPDKSLHLCGLVSRHCCPHFGRAASCSMLTEHTLNNVNSSVHHRILKKNKVTWSNCTAARITLPYTFYQANNDRSLKIHCLTNWIFLYTLAVHRLPSQTNDVRMSALSVRLS